MDITQSRIQNEAGAAAPCPPGRDGQRPGPGQEAFHIQGAARPLPLPLIIKASWILRQDYAPWANLLHPIGH